MRSIYQRLRERNLCNHRDFQVGTGLAVRVRVPVCECSVHVHHPAWDDSATVFRNAAAAACTCCPQNIGVNGARTTSMAPPGVINAFQRNQTTDAPVLVFYALVCVCAAEDATCILSSRVSSPGLVPCCAVPCRSVTTCATATLALAA